MIRISKKKYFLARSREEAGGKIYQIGFVLFVLLS
jgi:hypothetical protein